MANEIPGRCPICGSGMEVTRVYCGNCDTTIEGHFRPCKFCTLTPEQKLFIDIFVKCRGNIKEVEKELGVSYPTVRNRLEDVAGALGYKEESETRQTSKRIDTLDRLNRGEITVDEAISMLKD